MQVVKEEDNLKFTPFSFLSSSLKKANTYIHYEQIQEGRSSFLFLPHFKNLSLFLYGPIPERVFQ